MINIQKGKEKRSKSNRNTYMLKNLKHLSRYGITKKSLTLLINAAQFKVVECLLFLAFQTVAQEQIIH